MVVTVRAAGYRPCAWDGASYDATALGPGAVVADARVLAARLNIWGADRLLTASEASSCEPRRPRGSPPGTGSRQPVGAGR